MEPDWEYVRTMNVVIMGVSIVVCAVVVILVSTRSSAYARADRFSQQIRLPYGSARTRESVVARVQSASRASALAMLVGILAAAWLLLTPLAATPAFPLYVIFPVLIATAIVSALASVRERLFHPAPNAPRVARARAVGVVDYLDPVRRMLPWLLACAAGASVVALGIALARTPEGVNGVLATAAFVFAAVAVATLVVVPPLERRVLAQAQPATDTLELAWDDAFRSTTIGQLRLSMAFAAWGVIASSVGAIWIGADGAFSGLAWQLPTLGLIALQFVYPGTGRRLPAALYPDWLRRPATVGGTA
ncbi:hypothetical protein K0817_011210 [Microbacterium sp. HD4P20]|uniref:hypothetical protein n=1 Tax=Microbacterium sp. HD4P20 TaxID=2864874 RepID=UPI001C644B34|nr:hypothetical protein [Microbacterium sp. HD4P20]MCP2637126.1 hypothetical protein [Microbacterium sp. HD4P20]